MSRCLRSQREQIFKQTAGTLKVRLQHTAHCCFTIVTTFSVGSAAEKIYSCVFHTSDDSRALLQLISTTSLKTAAWIQRRKALKHATTLERRLMIELSHEICCFSKDGEIRGCVYINIPSAGHLSHSWSYTTSLQSSRGGLFKRGSFFVHSIKRAWGFVKKLCEDSYFFILWEEGCVRMPAFACAWVCVCVMQR